LLSPVLCTPTARYIKRKRGSSRHTWLAVHDIVGKKNPLKEV
jgi:hypothetical protein